MRSKYKVVGVVASLPPIAVLVDADKTLLRVPLTSREYKRLSRRHPVLSSENPSRCQLNRAKVRGKKRGRCRHTEEIGEAISGILGSSSRARSCDLVSSAQMDRILRQHNWDSGEGVVGFHTPDDRVYVTKQWSVPHEWVHAAGLVDDKLGMWICEGLTESVAEAAAKQARAPYRPTYDYERSLVEEQLAPALGMTPIQLARQVVGWYGSGKSPAEEIARLLGSPRMKGHFDRGSGDAPTREALRLISKANARPRKGSGRRGGSPLGSGSSRGR